MKAMNDYRSLAVEEIDTLERQGCTADDWTRISVGEEFNPQYVRNVSFHGDVCLGVFEKQVEVVEGAFRHTGIRNATLYDVAIGDNCLIENIGCHICRYSIGEDCYISNVGTMAITEGATFGQAGTIAVMNEAGDGNVFVYDGLTSQTAALMVECSDDKEAQRQLRRMVERYAEENRPEQGTVGYRVKVVNTREVVNTAIGEGCEINGASRLRECTIQSKADEETFIGSDVICDNTIIRAGASVTDGAKLDNCFVDEACRIGRGFSAENSVFFANSNMYSGEACAAFCGPFSVSHHKSTLLIGGRYSFYNAGSNTNFSNHAYKLGPVHYGSLERGSKTASGAHVLWPAQIGAFSVCIGKIQNHPDTRLLPFSYVIGGTDGTTKIAPGRNLTTAGTFRDVAKWPKRDMRLNAGTEPRHSLDGDSGWVAQSMINFDWLNPVVVGEVVAGKRLLERLMVEQGRDAGTYDYRGCAIKGTSLRKGIKLYEMGIRLCLGQAAKMHRMELPDGNVGVGEWTELAGLLAPAVEVGRLKEDIANGDVECIQQLEHRLSALDSEYGKLKWNWAYALLTERLGTDALTPDDLDTVARDYEEARCEWMEAVRKDAQREFDMGDVGEEALDNFYRQMKLQDEAEAAAQGL